MSESQPFYAPNRTFVDTTRARPRETLFEFLVGHDRWLCELVDLGRWGVDAQFFKNEEFVYSRRFDERLDATRTPRAMSITWATEERLALEPRREMASDG